MTGINFLRVLVFLFLGVCLCHAAEPSIITVDDDQGAYTGDWVESVKVPALVGKGYRHDDNRGKGSKTARFSAIIPAAGEYEIRVLYSPTRNRATNVPVAVEVPGESLVVKLNERELPPRNGVFHVVYKAGDQAVLSLSNQGTDGFVVVDAVQWVPVELARLEASTAQPAGRHAVSTGESRARAAAVALSPLAPKEAVKPSTPLKPDTEPVLLAKAASAAEVNGKHYDLVVVGGTGSGVMCAVRAAREGCKVLLVQHNGHIGGMMTNGLMQWDALYGGPRSPLFSELLGRIERHYIDTSGRDSRDHQIIRCTHEHYPVSWVEPHVAEREFNRLVAGEKNITLLLSHYVETAEREGALLKGLTLREYSTTKDIQVTGDCFADASYEGDLAAAAKVPYHVGRESRDEYHEPHAGKIFVNIDSSAPQSAAAEGINIRAYTSRQGSVDPTSPFSADGAVQAYNYRFCVSRDETNRLLPGKPANYNRDEFLHFDRKSIATNGGPALKSHMNSPILPGENHAYPEAGWPEREKIIQRHRDFALGLMWFLQNDESVPEAKRADFRKWGLARDEFTDHDHIPYEMYVREARRIVGRHMFIEQDNSRSPDYARAPVQPDSVAITDWYMDSHSCTKDSRPGFRYDGKLILTEESRPAQIPWRSLLPQGVDNLIVPVCLGASHVAWGAVRLEPVWMQTGEAAGFAAGLAHRQKIAPAALDPVLLVRTLADHRQLVSFFNDFKVNGEEAWIPAVEYLATQGFFSGYDAKAAEPLDKETARLWARAAVELKGKRLDGRKLAAAVAKADSKETVTREAFLDMLPQGGAEVKQGGKPITRGEACVKVYQFVLKP